MFSPIAAFSQGGKPADRVEVLSIAQSFHGIGSCLSDRSQKCHKTELIRSLYILKIHKNAMCLFCVLGKCRYAKVGLYNSLFHLMSFVSSTNNLLPKVTSLTASCFHVPDGSRAK